MARSSRSLTTALASPLRFETTSSSPSSPPKASTAPVSASGYRRESSTNSAAPSNWFPGQMATERSPASSWLPNRPSIPAATRSAPRGAQRILHQRCHQPHKKRWRAPAASAPQPQSASRDNHPCQQRNRKAAVVYKQPVDLAQNRSQPLHRSVLHTRHA